MFSGCKYPTDLRISIGVPICSNSFQDVFDVVWIDGKAQVFQEAEIYKPMTFLEKNLGVNVIKLYGWCYHGRPHVNVVYVLIQEPKRHHRLMVVCSAQGINFDQNFFRQKLILSIPFNRFKSGIIVAIGLIAFAWSVIPAHAAPLDIDTNSGVCLKKWKQHDTSVRGPQHILTLPISSLASESNISLPFYRCSLYF